MTVDPIWAAIAYVWRFIQFFTPSRNTPSAYRRAVYCGAVLAERRAIRTDTQIASAAILYIFTVYRIGFSLRKAYGFLDLFCDC